MIKLFANRWWRAKILTSESSWHPSSLFLWRKHYESIRERNWRFPTMLKKNSGSIKNETAGPNEVIYAKPHTTKPKLNYSFHSPRSGFLNQSIRNPMISPNWSNQVICLIDPYHPLKASKLAINNLLFCLISLSCSLLPSACRHFSFCKFLGALFFLLDWLLTNSRIVE